MAENNKENYKLQSLIKKYTKNLNELYKKEKEIKIIGRDKEIREIVDVLSKLINNNPLLIGNPGVGKTTVIKGLVEFIENGKVPNYLLKKKIIQLDIISLMSGTKFHGDLEERVKLILDYISDSNNNAILFIDDIHLISSNRFGPNPDLLNLVKPMLSNGNIQCIAICELNEYYSLEKDKALIRRFSTVYVKEPTLEETYKILRGVAPYFEKYCSLKIFDEALDMIIRFSHRYLIDRFFPDKAISLLDETCARVKSGMWYDPERIISVKKNLEELKRKTVSITAGDSDEKQLSTLFLHSDIKKEEKKLRELEEQDVEEKKNIEDLETLNKKLIDAQVLFKRLQENFVEEDEDIKQRVFDLWYKEIPAIKEEISVLETQIEKNILRNHCVKKEQVADTIERKYGIRSDKILMDEKKKIKGLMLAMYKRIKGQNEALTKVNDAILRARIGVQNPKLPLASFFFVGPTGVGKTEVALVLAEQLLGDASGLLRFNMTEFSEAHSVSKFIGSPPGYIGYEQVSLFEKAREKINNVIVFDEIEKCHSQVLNLFLQILDNGVLLLSNKKEVNFRNSIIVFTSNWGSELYLDYQDEELQKKIKCSLEQRFPPEFLNRLSEIVCFNQLDKETIREIIKKEMDDFILRVKEQENLELTYDINPVVEKIFNESYSPTYGARPIKRYIDHKLGTMIAKGIIYDVIGTNNKCWVFVDKENQKFRISCIPFLEKGKEK